MAHSSKSTPILEGKMNWEDTPSGANYKDKYKVELGAILSSIQFYL